MGALLRVLCVDDEPQVLQGLERTLRREFPMVTAVGGEKALEVLRKDRDFAVIISDMRMPGMDGAAFLSEARLLVPEAARVLLTGQADLESVVKAVNDGSIHHYVKKPASKDELVRVVHTGFAAFEENLARTTVVKRAVNGSLRLMTALVRTEAPKAHARMESVRALASSLGVALGLRDDFGLGVAATVACAGQRLSPAERAAVLDEVLGSDGLLAGAKLALQDVWSASGTPSAMARVVLAAMALDEVDRDALSPAEKEKAREMAVEPRILDAWRKLPRAA